MTRLDLVAGATLLGTVTSAGGEVDSHAVVQLVGLGGRAHTDPQGVYRFEGLAPGEYLVQAGSSRYGSSVLRVSLTAGENRLDITLDVTVHQEVVAVSSFPMTGWDDSDWSERTIRYLDETFARRGGGQGLEERRDGVPRSRRPDRDDRSPALRPGVRAPGSEGDPLIAHLGEPREDVIVETAARVRDLQYQSSLDRDKVREFLILYQDRVACGTDLSVGPGTPTGEAIAAARARWLADWSYFATDEPVEVRQLKQPVSGLQLPRAVVEKIYRLNAERFLGGDPWREKLSSR